MIRLIATGGTFEKRYNPLTYKMDVDESVIPEILEVSRCPSKIKYERLLNKLSCDFKTSDYNKIIRRCKDCRESQIIITHGTDTITKTAKLLSKSKINKTIVLVGAFVPYTVAKSDSAFNLGFALAAAQTLPAGVYIAINGSIFLGSKVKKNKAKGVFESVG